MAVPKSRKSWVRSPNIRLMRGCEKHPSVKKLRNFDTHGEGRGSLGTHLRGTRSYCSDKRKTIEDKLRASGESKEDNVKNTNEYVDQRRTDRKRVKNETGLGSPSTGAVTRRSEVVGFSGEAEEGEPNLSDGFGLGSERGPSGGEETFSLLASIVDMMYATRRDGRRPENEDRTEGVHVSISMPRHELLG